MPISFSCDRCGSLLRVKDQFAGQRIKCRDCGGTVDVPARRRRRKKSSGGSRTALIVGGIVIAVLLVCGGGITAMVMMFRGGGEDDVVARFAPGGQEVDISPGGAPAGRTGPPSRFDSPDIDEGSGGVPVQPAGPPNPSAGMGLGATVCVADYWSDRSQSGRDNEFEVLSQEPDVLPPRFWRVSVDPPVTPVELTADSNRRIKLPEGSQQASAGDIVFPVVSSGIVAVGQNATEHDKREVWDLTSMEKVGTIRDLAVETTHNTISPDGHYFAGVTGRTNQVIGVWDVVENKVAVDIAVPSEAHSIDFLGMPTGDRMVGHGWWNKTYYLWSLPDGRLEREITIDWRGHYLEAPAFSPGGRYMALTVTDWGNELIKLYDLDTGQEAGSLSLPDYGFMHRLSVHGLAFSPDGTMLAAIVNGWAVSKLLVWDLAGGELVDHMTFEKTLKELALDDWYQTKKAQPLVWFPGNNMLLAYEMLILDREVDTAIWKLTGGQLRDNFPNNRWPLSENRLTVLNASGRDGVIELYELSEDDLQGAREKVVELEMVAPRIQSVLVNYGRASSVDRSATQQGSVSDVTWSAEADPAPGFVQTARPIDLVVPRGTIRQVGLSRTENAVAVALRSTAFVPWSRIPWGNEQQVDLKSARWHAAAHQDDHTASARATGGRAWIDVYDLSAGERLRELRLPTDADLVSVSPDGSQCLLITYESDNNQLIVLSTETGEVVANWIPYNFGVEEDKLLVSATFLDDAHVLTLSGSGTLMIWAVPDVKAVFEVGGASQPTGSPGGRYVSYSDGTTCHFVETATGNPVGRIPDIGDLRATAYHPDGAHVALLSEYNAGYYLFTVDLISGDVSAPFPVPVTSGFLRWFGDRYLLIDNQKLVDVAQKAVAWSYELSSGDPVPYSFDDRHWYVADSDGTAVLTATHLPDPSAAQQLGGATLRPEFLVKPGDSVSISLQLNQPAFTASAKRNIENALAAQLEQQRISVAAGQPVTLRVTATEQTGETITRQYDAIGFGESQDVTFTLKNTRCRVEFVSGGQSAWNWETGVSNDSWFVHYEEGQSIAQVLEDQYQKSLPNAFNNVVLPPYVFTPTAANGLGSTALTR